MAQFRDSIEGDGRVKVAKMLGVSYRKLDRAGEQVNWIDALGCEMIDVVEVVRTGIEKLRAGVVGAYEILNRRLAELDTKRGSRPEKTRSRLRICCSECRRKSSCSTPNATMVVGTARGWRWSTRNQG